MAISAITRRSLLRTTVALGAASLLPSLASCSSASTDDTYKIGALFAVSGFNSPLGTPEKETALMIEEQVNAKGGIKGKKLKVIVYDTESDETKAVTLAKQLIEQDKVLAIVGPSSTGESLALVDTVERAQLPLISAAASAKIVQPVKKWVFKTPQSDALAVSELFTYFGKQKISKIAILTSTGGFGVTGKDAIMAAAPGAGISVVAAETFADTDTDMTVQLTKIKGSSAQGLLVWGTNPGPARIAKNVKQLAISIPLFQSHGIANQTFIQQAEGAAEGVIFPAGRLLIADSLPDSDPQKPVLLAYARDFSAKYGKPADTFGGHAYDALTMLTTAIDKVGADRAKIRDEIENVKGFIGTGGVFNMSKDDHNGLGPGAFAMIRITNGKWEPVAQ